MAKRKPQTIPQKVTRYYPCFHDMDNRWPYQLGETYFRTFSAAAKAAKFENESDKWFAKEHDRERLNYFVAKVVIEPAQEPVKKASPKKRKAA